MKRVLWAAALLAPWLASEAAGGPEFDCLIEPAQVVEIRTTVEGLIEKVNVRRGDPVRRGQVLAELQSRAERLAVESARLRATMEGQITTAHNRIDYATKKYARAQELEQEQMVSTQARDEADAELKLAQAELQAAIENRAVARVEHQRAVEQLALRTLVSPFDGVVVDRMLNPGDLAESGTGRKPLLKLAQTDPLRVNIVLPGAYFGKVRPGARVVVAPHGSDARYVAAVRMVDKLVDAASGTLVAQVEIANRDGSVPIGMQCKAVFDPLPAVAPAATARQAGPGPR